MIYQDSIITKPYPTAQLHHPPGNNLISAVIISYNEESNIARCINSLKKVADEIIVLDSFSSDKTSEIATLSGAVVYKEKFKGYIEQKNRGIQFAKNRSILSLDADETLSDELMNSILNIKQKLFYEAYAMNRCTNYCGRFIRHGSWYPDEKVRLFDKTIAEWGGVNPHDKIEFKKNVVIKKLKGDILHYSYKSIDDHLLQNIKFSTISAKTLYSKGIRSSWVKILLHPLWAFIYSYVIRKGFLDGFLGFVIAINSAHQTFLKYIKLYQLDKKNT